MGEYGSALYPSFAPANPGAFFLSVKKCMKWFGPLCSPAAARWLVSLVLVVGGDLRGLKKMTFVNKVSVNPFRLSCC